MSTKARIAHLFSPLTRWWLPEATPARLLLFFIVTAVFVLASILWGLFVKYPSMHNVGVALCIVALYSIVFATTFAMAKPDMDRKLQKHRRKLLTVSKIIAVMLAVGSIGTAIVMIPWLYTNGNVSVFGRIQIPPATSDDIVITRQANQLLLDGKDPYGHTNIIKAMKDYKTVAPTPLQQGDFEDIYPTPSEEQIDDEIIEAKANPDVVPPEFESTLSYPAGAFLFRIPFDASGIAPQWFYLLCILVMVTIIVWRVPKYLRPAAIIGCLASVLVWNSQFGGGTESLFILFILLGWTLRKRPWLAAILIGIACSCKQTACFFALFYLVLLLREAGWRKAIYSLVMIGATFVLINSPFIIADPRAWLTGVFAPIMHPLFPFGVGISSFATLSNTPAPKAIFTALECIAFIVALAWYYRNCRKAPQTGLLLAIIPLFFAWRSVFAYFVTIPLLVFGATLIEEYKQGQTAQPAPTTAPL
jgi:hypothetical protein